MEDQRFPSVFLSPSRRLATSVPFLRDTYVLPPSLPGLFSSAAKRANLRSQFDRDFGPDSARPRCIRVREPPLRDRMRFEKLKITNRMFSTGNYFYKFSYVYESQVKVY